MFLVIEIKSCPYNKENRQTMVISWIAERKNMSIIKKSVENMRVGQMKREIFFVKSKNYFYFVG